MSEPDWTMEARLKRSLEADMRTLDFLLRNENVMAREIIFIYGCIHRAMSLLLPDVSGELWQRALVLQERYELRITQMERDNVKLD